MLSGTGTCLPTANMLPFTGPDYLFGPDYLVCSGTDFVCSSTDYLFSSHHLFSARLFRLFFAGSSCCRST